ncbi:menaquinone reductase integral membrane subunit QrcD [Nitratidesulfovibrio liaohensis]|uniref:Polysulfide reductase NrfD n=1 Tax=Nitratidesulfovibrio liaohensis TaxID=2604158 RepID=A0ABY9R0N7_9BACT|nr:menaquinone reductase integral membrane subunit QrcD [Nitratidesulfovibrio liaohensis]WMW65029.1 polysulfide reductase NrfD [Nitratidesulfovibrio liaohensis]
MDKNYDLPIDAALFPEGCTRCSLSKFLVWITIVMAVFGWGLYAAYRVLAEGLGVTGLDDYFGFGLWITFDLAVIALGAGAFFTGLLRYILNIDPLKNIINLTVIVGFLCYSGAMLVLVLDVGQPLRAWFGYWHANVHSMLTEVIFCITCYLLVLIIEYVPLILEQKQLNRNKLVHAIAHNFHLMMPLFAGIGAFLSTFHQGSLGGMYGVLFARPYIARDGFFIWPWTFFLYVLSAVGSGPVFTVLVCTIMEKMTGKQLVSWEIKSLMGKIAGTMLTVYMVFKLADTWAWANGILPRSGLTFDQVFYGWIYGKWLLWAELFACGVLPAIILIIPSTRNNRTLFYTAAILDCIGVTINRYVMTVQALAAPVMPFDSWETYAPNWAEWGASAMIMAYAALVLSLSYRYLPVFPQEVKLNK